MKQRPVLAVVPFGAREQEQRTGAVARQLARRIVRRFEGSGVLEAKPVFLVALSEGASASGLLVFGSAPDAKLAAEYARGVSATHALFGVVEDATLRTTLVTDQAREVARFEIPLSEEALPRAEGRLAADAARALGVPLSEEAESALESPPTGNADAYRALLEGMDLEMAATVMQRDRPRDAEERFRAAAGSYLAALRADPAFELAEERVLYLVAELAGRDENERAMELLEDLITTNPYAWRGHYMLGELRRDAGLAAQAVVAFEHAAALHPLSDADQLRLARLYVETDALDAAAARLRRIGRASGQYAEAQAELGLIATRRGDLRGAAESFERAKAAGERSGVLFARLGQSYAGLGDPGAARGAFEEGIGTERSWPLLAAYATFLHGEANFSRAIALYREALEAGAPAPTRLNLARALVVTGQLREAERELRALHEHGADLETLAQARRLLFGIEHPEGERRLEEAGQVAVGGREGDVAQSRDTLAQIAVEHADLWEAHFGLGVAHRRLGEFAEAEGALRHVLELWPDQPDSVHELGVVLLARGKVDEAIAALDRATRHRPDDAGYVADAGFAHMVGGDHVAARSRLEHALRLDPDDEITKRYLAELQKREAAGRS